MTEREVLISIQPKWVEKIASGEKTIEVRKSRPKLQTPFKCYIYCTIGNGVKWDYLVPSGIQCGKVIGEFVCDRIDDFLVFENGTVQYWNCHELEKSCLTYNELSKYIGKNKKGYGWHITDLKIYDKPKDLNEFRTLQDRCKLGYTKCGKHYCGIYPCDYMVLKRPPQSWCYVEP